MDLPELKAVWNKVLDAIEQENRIAWLSFFDARLVSLENDRLLIDFTDSDKFSGGSDFQEVRKRYVRLLQDKIQEITEVKMEVVW